MKENHSEANGRNSSASRARQAQPDYKKIDLAQLILKAKDGDKLALKELISREQKNIQTTLYHLKANSDEVSDISQDVLLKVTKNITKLKNPLMFRSWLKQITTNQFYDTLRKKRRALPTATIKSDEKEEMPEVPDYTTNPHHVMLGGELERIIKHSIEKLSPKYRTAIEMRELEGLTYEEIANATNSSIGTVKSRIARARSKLQEYIEPYMREK